MGSVAVMPALPLRRSGGQHVVGAERGQRDRDLRQRLGVRREAGAQIGEVGQDACVEAGVDQRRRDRPRSRARGRAPARRRRAGRRPSPAAPPWRRRRAGDRRRAGRAGRGRRARAARHGLGPERVDDVAVVDDMGAAAVAVAAAARQGHQMRAAEEDLEPVVVEAHPQPVADEARGHGVEDPAEHEAAGGGDRDHGLLAVLGAPVRQRPQHGALGVDALAVAGVAAADQRVDEGAVVGDRVEVARAAQQQRVLDGALEMAVRRPRSRRSRGRRRDCCGWRPCRSGRTARRSGRSSPPRPPARGCGTPPRGCRCGARAARRRAPRAHPAGPRPAPRSSRRRARHGRARSR